jgi:hypothetical protein
MLGKDLGGPGDVFVQRRERERGGGGGRRRRACNAHFGGEVLHGQGVLDNPRDLSAECVDVQG